MMTPKLKARPILRTALLEKAQWTKQQLSARAVQLRKAMPMDLETAHAVIAHQHGMKLDRFLSPLDLAHVRHVLTQLNGAVAGSQRAPAAPPLAGRQGASGRTRAGRATPSSRGPRPLVFTNMSPLRDPLLSATKLQEAQEMAAIYPV